MICSNLCYQKIYFYEFVATIKVTFVYLKLYDWLENSVVIFFFIYTSIEMCKEFMITILMEMILKVIDSLSSIQ